jgi:hypothetical protein
MDRAVAASARASDWGTAGTLSLSASARAESAAQRIALQMIFAAHLLAVRRAPGLQRSAVSDAEGGGTRQCSAVRCSAAQRQFHGAFQ